MKLDSIVKQVLGKLRLVGNTDGTLIGNVGDALKVSGTFSPDIGTVSTLNSTTTPLGSNGNFTGTWELVTDFAAISVVLISDKNSATNGFKIEFSTDGTNVDHFDQVTYTAANGGCPLETPTHCKFFRVNYTNTNSAQTYFRLQTTYYTVNPGKHSGRLDGIITSASHAQLTKSLIVGASSSGGGTYENVKVTPSGAATIAIGDITGVDGQATMAASFPVVIASDQSPLPIAQAAPVVPVTGSGTLTALNSDVIFDNSAGYSSISFIIGGTWVGTITPAVSVNGVSADYLSWECADRTTFYTSMTANGSFEADIANWRYFRLRMTAYTSGTASVAYFATTNPSSNKRIILNTQTSSAAGASQRSQVVTIDTEHDKVHLGLLFNWSHTVNLNNGGVRRISMTTGAQTEHTVFSLTADYQINFRVYEGSTTTDGAAITEYNHNRSSANTSLCTVAQVTTFTTAGTNFFGPFIFGSTSGSAAGMSIPRANEWILKSSTKYVFEMTSLQNNNDITLVVDHYRNQA